MKTIIILLLILTTMNSYAAGKKTLHEANDPCRNIGAYQPQSRDVVTATGVFNIKMTYSACSLRETLNLKKDQYMYVMAFSMSDTGNRFKYMLTTFGPGTRVTQQVCKVSSRFEYKNSGSLAMATTIEIFSSPICSQEDVIQN